MNPRPGPRWLDDVVPAILGAAVVALVGAILPTRAGLRLAVWGILLAGAIVYLELPPPRLAPADEG